ncbi:MAG: assimilatory sulfite reductase (NADPH) flavoprotein subunit [Pseudomonadota bacterium]
MSTVAKAVAATLPLEQDQLDSLTALGQVLPPDALLWSSGYLAGIAAARASAQDAPTSPVATNAPRLTILFGSQTGNGQRLAEDLAVQAAQRSVNARVVNLSDYRPADIRREKAIALIVSTHGEGEPPDDAEALYDFLMSERAPRLESLVFSVLGLGDSSYAQFCQTGIDFDARLAELGATRLADRVDCDTDFAEPAAAWADVTLQAAANVATPVATAPILHAVKTPLFSAERPFASQLVVNQKITGRDSTKDVRHIEFDIDGSGLTYEPGDALGIHVANPPALVSELCEVLGLDSSAAVGDSTLAAALSDTFEITVASRAFVDRYAALTGNAELARLLEDDQRQTLAAYLAERQIVDIVREHPSLPTAAEFLACLRPLKPRLYSIASSPLVSNAEIAITVAAVRYEAYGRAHWGAASTHLADQRQPGDSVSIYVEPNPRFRLPTDPTLPIIMVGPGTGVAPFRAFLEHRDASGAGGDNWLFFGDRESREDFLYQLDWARYRKRGVLTRMDVAFSRDQTAKIYVQDRLREHGTDVFAWLQRGAHLYVCGDATSMAPDVHAALIDIVATGLGDDRAAAEDYVKQLKRDGRYQRDVY